MGALAQYQQEPAVIILENMDVFMGDLPQQQIKVFHGGGFVYVLGNILAAFRFMATIALVDCL